jgi:branched-chain amino acid aminotransferase
METITYIDGGWAEGSVPLMSSTTQAAWLSAVVFDGARAFGGVAPDLDLHCQRVIRSAQTLGLKPVMSPGEIEELAWEGIAKFPSGSELYIRPMFWAEDGMVMFEADSTRFALVIHVEPLPGVAPFTCHISRFRRPAPDQAPTVAKASCLYPNATLALREAKRLGFGNAIMLDPIGNVAEFTGSNVFMVKDGVAHTPIPNGTFLNGITRQRVARLLIAAGTPVVERSIAPGELLEADELFSTGNYAKIQPLCGVEQRALQPGPVAVLARKLYWDYAFA